MSEQLYTKEQVCERLHFSVRTLERLMKQGKVQPVKFGKLVYFREHHIAQLIDNCDLSKARAKKS
jgi:excisionase family DNA binding protein